MENKKKIIITSIVLLISVGGIFALLNIKGSSNNQVTLYADGLEMENSETVDVEGKATEESLPEMLSDWTGLDFKLNSIEVDGDSVSVDWNSESSLFSDLEDVKPKEGFYFDDLESLQWFMLDSLAKTLQQNLGISNVYFTMNDGQVLNLNIIILWGDEPYMGSDFFLAHEDNKGDEYQNTYYDSDNKLLLTYPSVFSEKSKTNDNGNISFASLQDKSILNYYVVTNVYNDTPEKFYNSVNAEKIERLDGNVVVGLKNELDLQNGKNKPCVLYWLVEEEYIAIASIECDSMEEAARWYKLIKNGEVNIDKVVNFDNEKGDLSITYNTYIDDEYGFQLTYTSLFSDKASLDEYGYINFESVQDNDKLFYWVTSNSNQLTVHEFLEEIKNDVEECKFMSGNICIGLVKNKDEESEDEKFSATYWLVEKDYIASASIECMNMKEAKNFYNSLDEGIVNIDVISKMDHDEQGEMEYDMQEYYDDEYNQILSYPTSFLSEGSIGEYKGNSCIVFESKINNDNLSYVVIDNNDKVDSESYVACVDANKIEILADKTVISKMQDLDDDGNPSYYNVYSLVNTDNITVVMINCEDLDSSTYWYDQMKNDAINIEELDVASKESAVDSYKITMNDEDITSKMDLSIIDDELYAEAKSYFEALLAYGNNPVYYCEYNENAVRLEIISWATDAIVMYIEPGIDGIYRYTGMNMDSGEDEFEFITFDLPILTLEDDTLVLPVESLSDYLDDGYNGVTIEKE